jgi:hypothetical protein
MQRSNCLQVRVLHSGHVTLVPGPMTQIPGLEMTSKYAIALELPLSMLSNTAYMTQDAGSAASR